MQLGYVGINYKNTDLSVRDKITFTDSGIADFMQQAEEAGVKQCMCLSTCNRCEVFYLYEDETFVQVMSDLFNDYFGLTDTKLAGVKCGEEALVYLFCIAAGLESMVLGEDQILGQLKDAADLSRTLGHSGKELNYIVREAVSCAKRIKTEYKVSEKPVSVCYVGIQELDRVCGISGKHALVIGSGKTAALAIRYLAEYGADVTVCSRTYQHAKALLKVHRRAGPAAAGALPVHRVAGVPDRAGDPAAVRILRRRNSEGAADYAGVAGAGGRDYSFHDRDQAGVRLRIGQRRKEVRAGKRTLYRAAGDSADLRSRHYRDSGYDPRQQSVRDIPELSCGACPCMAGSDRHPALRKADCPLARQQDAGCP